MKRDTQVRRHGPSRAVTRPQLQLPAPPPPEQREREPEKKPSKKEGGDPFVVDFRVDSYV